MELPWYSRLEKIVAPTEKATNVALVVLICLCLLLLWKGDSVMKAAFVVYMVSP
jgi:hypothetical protein